MTVARIHLVQDVVEKAPMGAPFIAKFPQMTVWVAGQRVRLESVLDSALESDQTGR